MRQVQRLDKTMIWDELSLVLMDNRSIARLHDRYLGDERATDVISFAYPPEPGAGTGYTGEIFVNVERAVTVGPSHNGVVQELALYVAHGCHHLTGADDHTPQLRARMRRVDLRWLRRAEADGLLNNWSIQTA